MIAVLTVPLPFDMHLLVDHGYAISTYIDGDCEVTFDLPVRLADHQTATSTLDDILIDGNKAFAVNALVIKFKRETFDRSVQGALEYDPSIEMMERAVRFLLERIKYVVRAPQVVDVPIQSTAFSVQYLNDDCSELPEEAGRFRLRRAFAFKFSVLGCTPSVWRDVHSLPLDFKPPAFESLLIDARSALPHVGSSIVLAASALEVLISPVLDRLAARSTIPPALWKWINDRGDWQKEPSVNEQFSDLLQVLTGYSLKSDIQLWDGMKNLRSARNTFVHEGKAVFGGKEVTPALATQWIENAEAVSTKLRTLVPPEDQWPLFNHKMQVQMIKNLFKAEEPNDKSQAALPQ